MEDIIAYGFIALVAFVILGRFYYFYQEISGNAERDKEKRQIKLMKDALKERYPRMSEKELQSHAEDVVDEFNLNAVIGSSNAIFDKYKNKKDEE